MSASEDLKRQAIEVLRSEANQLAALVDAKQFSAFHYRVEIAVENEMKRLRGIADSLRAELPERSDEI